VKKYRKKMQGSSMTDARVMYVGESRRKIEIHTIVLHCTYSHTNTLLQTSEEDWPRYDAVCQLPVWEDEASACERKRCCATCEWAVTRENHECNKRFCDNCNQTKEIGHLCYMRPLKDALPLESDKVLYVFYDFETTHNTEYTADAKLRVSNLVCVQQFCSRCDDVEVGDCVRCGKRKHSFLQGPVGELLSYLNESRPWANKIFVIAHNSKAFDIHLILNRAIILKWKPELIMSGLKIMCMKIEHLVFLDSVSFLPCALRKLPEAYGLTASKSWYPHYFNT